MFRLPYIPIFPSNRKQYSKKRWHFELDKFNKIRIYTLPKQKDQTGNQNMDIRKQKIDGFNKKTFNSINTSDEFQKKKRCFLHY